MEYSSKDIRNIAFEKINDRFSKGNYLGVEVTIDMTTGYVNGPHLVGQVKSRNNKPKQFIHWRETKESKEIINCISQTEGINSCDLIVDLVDAPNGFRGAYIHRFLVIHAAMWASPVFAHKIGKIMDYISSQNVIVPRDVTYVDPRAPVRIGCVYFVSDGNFIKVGCTYDLPKRLGQLQTSNARQLTVVASINVLEPESVEQEIHGELSDKCVRGEWFNISAADALVVAARYA